MFFIFFQWKGSGLTCANGRVNNDTDVELYYIYYAYDECEMMMMTHTHTLTTDSKIILTRTCRYIIILYYDTWVSCALMLFFTPFYDNNRKQYLRNINYIYTIISYQSTKRVYSLRRGGLVVAAGRWVEMALKNGKKGLYYTTHFRGCSKYIYILYLLFRWTSHQYQHVIILYKRMIIYNNNIIAYRCSCTI